MSAMSAMNMATAEYNGKQAEEARTNGAGRGHTVTNAQWTNWLSKQQKNRAAELEALRGKTSIGGRRRTRSRQSRQSRKSRRSRQSRR